MSGPTPSPKAKAKRFTPELGTDQAPWNVLLDPAQAHGVFLSRWKFMGEGDDGHHDPSIGRRVKYDHPLRFYNVHDMLNLRAVCKGIRGTQTTEQFLRALLKSAYGFVAVKPPRRLLSDGQYLDPGPHEEGGIDLGACAQPTDDERKLGLKADDMYFYQRSKPREAAEDSNAPVAVGWHEHMERWEWHRMLVEEASKQQFLRAVVKLVERWGGVVAGSYALHTHLRRGTPRMPCATCRRRSWRDVATVQRLADDGYDDPASQCPNCWLPGDIDVFVPTAYKSDIQKALSDAFGGPRKSEQWGIPRLDAARERGIAELYDVVFTETDPTLFEYDALDRDPEAPLHDLVCAPMPYSSTTVRRFARQAAKVGVGPIDNGARTELRLAAINYQGLTVPQVREALREALRGPHAANVDMFEGSLFMNESYGPVLRTLGEAYKAGWFEGERQMGVPRAHKIHSTSRVIFNSRMFRETLFDFGGASPLVGELGTREFALNIIAVDNLTYTGSGGPRTLLNQFDLQPCRIGLRLPPDTSSFDFVYGKDGKEAIETRTLRPTPEQFAPARHAIDGKPLCLKQSGPVARFARRLNKYRARGFELERIGEGGR